MTSTNIELDPSQPVAASADSVLAPIPLPSQADSPSADSSFSDAYKEEPVEANGVDRKADQVAEVSDDYAMTFESDGEEGADSQDITQPIVQQETQSFPVTVPATDSSSHQPFTNGVLQNGQTTQTTHASPPPSHPAILETAANIPNSTSAQASTTAAPTHSYEDITSGGIDIQQLLDNITANAEKNESASTAATQSPAQTPTSSLPKAGSSLPAHSSLPPRPQVSQDRTYNDDMQRYHTGPPGVPPQSASSYRPPGTAPPGASTVLIGAGAPGTSTDPRGGLPPPPSASFRQPPPSTASPISPLLYTQLNQPPGQGPLRAVETQDEVDDSDVKWGPTSRSFTIPFSPKSACNLPSEKLTKRDLFHVFHKYGRLAQISIKQAYGFIQFHDASACYAALDQEQGVEVRGRKMHLEISKPQKNSRNAQANAPPLRRSRSPEYARASGPDRGGRHGQHGGRMPAGDRYDGRSSVRQDEYGRPLRIRDDYRPVRSPTPPGASFRGRDEYMPRGRDQYDGRDRRRSRSRSPYGNRDNMRYRERSPSPRARQTTEDEDLQIPRRLPHDVPDVQIILMDQLDRGFVAWVEGEFRGRNIKTEVMFLSPRLPLQAVIHRQILEGVHAVSQLTMRSQNSSKIPLQVFDRQGGANNVRFDEYQDLEPKIAAELVLRAKQSPPQPQAPQYSQPQFPAGQSYQPPAPAPAPAPVAANIANLVGQLDNAALQKLLGSLNAPQHHNAPAVSANSSLDLAGLLGGFNPPPQHNGYALQPAADPYANLAANPALASLLGGGALPPQAQAQPQQNAQQVQNIMAQLAKFRQ
ncbi:hypothetical protein G7Y89_g6819 [Cudoniella acicularis]|uniref:RRM domain-containing protein n=1 Tax=Cudoniella acicularis TaxID=354080 RepID=A0A8H4W554_9HELO|nr:hypothetical protein G7Y89_g6819 [Cudoniella acicularis]